MDTTYLHENSNSCNSPPTKKNPKNTPPNVTCNAPKLSTLAGLPREKA